MIVHSTTKFLNGHSDSIGGGLIAARPEHSEWFAFVQKSAGAVIALVDLRGTHPERRPSPVRVAPAADNAALPPGDRHRHDIPAGRAA